MNLIEVIQEFEKGVSKPSPICFTSGDSHIELLFEDNGEYRDVFVYEIEKITIDKEMTIDGIIFGAGTSFLIEINHETPTAYGHELPFDDLINYIQNNYQQFDEGVVFISNFDNEWIYLEEFIGGKEYD